MNSSCEKKSLFSVIVPAYNSAEFINKCVDSVLMQTCTDFELILVDDGSKDSTLEICKEYEKKDLRVKVIHKENGGHTSARNEGLRASEGEYIIFLDSDDWLELQTLEACREQIEAHGSDVIIFRMKNSNSDAPFAVHTKDGYYSSVDWDNLMMGKDGKFVFPKSLSSKCFKREIIYDSQLSVPKKILVGEDGLAFIGAMQKAHGVSVIVKDDRACYHCLVRQNSVSRSSDPNAFERAGVLLNYYADTLVAEHPALYDQFARDVSAQLYTASLLVLRSGADKGKLNSGLSSVFSSEVIYKAFRDAIFNTKGYKLTVKRFILRYRLWWLVKILDR